LPNKEFYRFWISFQLVNNCRMPCDICFSILFACNPIIHSNLLLCYGVILNKSFLALYLFFRISCIQNEYNSFWIFFMNSSLLQLQSELETLFRTRSISVGRFETGILEKLCCCPGYGFQTARGVPLSQRRLTNRNS
jgi:hypothetical protein